MIARVAGALLNGIGMMWVVHVALEYSDGSILAAAIMFGIGAFLMGAQ